jgi:antitoxin FitA
MPKMIQVRHVPDRTHRKLKARAAAAGMSLSDYVRLELEALALRPTWDEFQQRLAALEAVPIAESGADAVRAERDTR